MEKSAPTTRTRPPPTRRPSSTQGQRPGGQALLHGARADGEPARAGRAGRCDPGQRNGRARGGARHGRPASSGHSNRLTLGADKGYDTSDFVADLRQKCVTPHVAQKAKGSAIDGRTTRHAGYAVSQEAQARRGGLRLGQDDRRLRQGQGARAGAGRIPLHTGNGRLQSDPHAETDRRGRLKRPRAALAHAAQLTKGSSNRSARNTVPVRRQFQRPASVVVLAPAASALPYSRDGRSSSKPTRHSAGDTVLERPCRSGHALTRESVGSSF